MGVTSIAAFLALVGTAALQQEAPREWQQGIEYRIEAHLDEAAEVLEGQGRIRYRNDSPDTLDTFYLHLYLNAFRPNSAWARRDLENGIRTFQDLGPDDHGFERIRALTVDGETVRLGYPYQPDSTIVQVALPAPILPGGSITLDVRWDARPSTVPRRQGRAGRQWDFAQWYPRVVVYDDEGWRPHPLYRAGEFYGEFATYDVTMDLAEDQVVGSTGIPVEGDPGWAAAAALGTGPVDFQREWYGSLSGPPCVERAGERVCGVFPARSLQAAEPLGRLSEAVAPGRKRIRWIAEDVHHFAWSTSPDYIYEQGRWDDVVIRVLYRPGDEESWGGGIAVRRTAVALEWLDSIFGDYAYPQVTNLHRIEGGGTEFPMLIMDGSASQSLILHEVGHIYAHGILANNEWYEGWLDEGLSTFQTQWFFERNADGGDPWLSRRTSTVLGMVTGTVEPVVLRAEDYSSQSAYSQAIYTRGALVFRMLRAMAGEEAMVRILRTYYERHRLRHVDSRDFQAVAEEVLRQDLDWFFGQWLHGTGVVDYALDDVRVEADASGGWVTSFRVRREGDIRMPVPVRITGEGRTMDTVVDGLGRDRTAAVRTDFRPGSVGLDPDGMILDVDPSNNGWAEGRFDRGPGWAVGWDDPTRPLPFRLDAVSVGFFPLAWVNDAGGVVAGIQRRTSLLGLHTTLARVGLPALPVGDRGEAGRTFDFGSVYLRAQDPIRGGRLRDGLQAEAFLGEGRGFLTGSVARPLGAPWPGDSPELRVFGTVSTIWDDAYPVPGRWSPGRRSGGELGLGLSTSTDGLGMRWSLTGSGGLGFDTDHHRWGRASLRADGTAPVADGLRLRARIFAGGATGTDDPRGTSRYNGDRVPAERRFFLSSADPWMAMGNPLVRSAGAPLDGEGWTAGGGTLLGFDPTLSLAWIMTGALEGVGPEAVLGGDEGVAIRPLAFLGAGWGARPGLPPLVTEDARLEAATLLWSAGVGAELARPGSPTFLRIDLPFAVSHPELAGDARTDRLGLRVQVGFGG